MLALEASISGDRELLARLDRLSEARVNRALQAAVTKTARDAATLAKQYAPYRSGDLRRAIQTEAVPDDAGAAARVFVPPINGVPYAVYVDKGTGEYAGGDRIRPTTKKVLAWVDYGYTRPTSSAEWRAAIQAGWAHIAPSVKGTPPNPFMEDAFESVILLDLPQINLANAIRKTIDFDADPEIEGGETLGE